MREGETSTETESGKELLKWVSPLGQKGEVTGNRKLGSLPKQAVTSQDSADQAEGDQECQTSLRHHIAQLALVKDYQDIVKSL